MKDHFLKIYGQLRDLFQSMTPGNRIIASLLITTLLVSLGFLVIGSIKPTESRSKYTYLFDGFEFSSKDKIAVESALSTGGLKDHEWVGNKLRVPKKSMASYAARIATEKAINVPGGALKDTAGALSPWDSNLSTSEKMLRAKEADAASSISKLEGVLSAEVIANRRKDWDKNVWARKEVFSVGVNVEPVGYKPLSDNTVAAIGGLISVIFGADPSLVRVVDNKNNRIYSGTGEEMGGGTSYSRAQAQYESNWKNKIYNILPHIEGLQVETTVVLTKLINESLFKVQHEKPKATIHEHIRGSDYLNEGYTRFGRPGQIAMMSRPLIQSDAGQDKAKITDKTHEEEKTNALQGTETKAEMIPFIPERIFASLQISMDHVRSTWIAKNRTKETPEPEATPEQLQEEEELIRQDTRKLVAKLLEEYRDPRKSPDPLDMVEVTFYEPIREPEPVMTSWQKTRVWLARHWQNLSLMGLVLCGMCVLWSITRPAKPDPIVIYEAPEIPMEVFEARAQAEAEAEAAARAEEEDEEFQRTLDGFDKSIRSLQEEIADLVEENPDAAAAVLRQWIGNIVPADANK